MYQSPVVYVKGKVHSDLVQCSTWRFFWLKLETPICTHKIRWPIIKGINILM